MDDRDLAVRQATYRLFAEDARAPAPAEVAAQAGMDEADVVSSWRRLHDAHALVLDDTRSALRMANPFSAVPTAFRVRAGGRDYWANCAWDAFGVCAALGVDGTFTTTCPDCDEPIEVTVRDMRPDDETLVFHCLVPARHWWEDIVFT